MSSQTSSHYSSKLSKKRLAGDQIQILESSFYSNQKLKAEFKLDLARQLGVPPRQVAIWYQNRRARQKVEIIEHDFKNIQQELGNVLAEKIKLEKEVRLLKNKLKKAQEMLVLASAQSGTTLLSGSTSDDDHSNSYSPANLNYNWLDTSKLPGEELYTCQTGPVCFQGVLTESMKPNYESHRDYGM